jgi:DNA-binding MurR/RpiR family transcriptional regulator
VAKIGTASCVHVTGFQSIRGLAEDFTRRLTMILPNVRFVAAYDGMLGEWLDEGDAKVLILFDIAPYARIAEKLVQMAQANGFTVIIITDEMNGWAEGLTPFVFHAATKVGAFLESVGSLAVISSLLLHSIAGQDEARTSKRMSEWPKKLHGLNLV